MDRNVPFTRNPTKLMYVLDSDLWKMLSILIQQEDYWTNEKKLEKDGSFYKPMSEFAEVFRKKNLQDVRLMLQTLQNEGFIDIINSKCRNQANFYRIRWDRIEEYNDIPIPQLLQSPMLKTVKRKNNKTVEINTESYQSDTNIDSTALYHQIIEDSTESYQQNKELIVQDCTTTIDNIQNINNNITIDNTASTKSSLYDAYKNRLDSLLSDYASESDYIRALDMYSAIQKNIEYASEHISTVEIEDYRSQLEEAQTKRERIGWNIKLDKITDDMMRNYHISNIFNVRTPQNDTSCRMIINDLLSKIDMYVNSERWNEIVEKTEQWITHQWECDRISYDAQQESIEKVYRKLSA